MPKFKYNPGDILGPDKTLMLERTFKEKSGPWQGKFKCSHCGQIFETRIKSVVRGNTRSCGCLQKRNAQQLGYKRFKDLTGKRFGLLVCLKSTDKKTEGGNYIWLCKCDCGNFKEVSNSDLVSGQVSSCGCLHSKGEAKIKSILTQNNIKFEEQKSFKECRSEKNCLLYFDFYLPNYNYCIEYDGPQHFFFTSGWNNEENFKKTQKRDQIKNQYCEQHNIKLIRISYKNFDKLSYQYLIDLLNKKYYNINIIKV